MTQAKYTLGPWKAVSIGRSLEVAPAICTLYNNDKASGEANAQLISAAPDLLEALKNATNVLAAIATGDLKTIERNSPAILLARVAISKAEGRS